MDPTKRLPVMRHFANLVDGACVRARAADADWETQSQCLLEVKLFALLLAWCGSKYASSYTIKGVHLRQL
jgi:hypothetical protein